jgi:hypothetical protein
MLAYNKQNIYLKQNEQNFISPLTNNRTEQNRTEQNRTYTNIINNISICWDIQGGNINAFSAIKSAQITSTQWEMVAQNCATYLRSVGIPRGNPATYLRSVGLPCGNPATYSMSVGIPRGNSATIFMSVGRPRGNSANMLRWAKYARGKSFGLFWVTEAYLRENRDHFRVTKPYENQI